MKQNNNFLVTIVDYFEDFLDEKGVRIPNEDRDREDPDNCANIYGDDFDEMMCAIRDICAEYGIEVEDKWEN